VLDGIYRVTFRSTQDQGKGIIVCKNGSINGGDSGFVYNGPFESQSNQIKAKLRVQKDNPNFTSIFGPFLTDFQLDLVGQASEPGFTLQGSVIGQPALTIIVEGEKIKDL
jgi:T3SS negative regulator,GrlR